MSFCSSGGFCVSRDMRWIVLLRDWSVSVPHRAAVGRIDRRTQS